MSENIVMPKLGVTMTEGTVEEWHKKVGDSVEAGESVLMISSEKLTQEIEAPVTGVLHEIKSDVAEEAKVGAVLGVIEQEGEGTLDSTVNETESESVPDVAERKNSVQTSGFSEGMDTKSHASNSNSERNTGARIFISPIARKMAKEHDLQIDLIKGTGGNNRITRIDINRVLKNGPDYAEGEDVLVEAKSTYHAVGEGLNPMRKAIAQNMRSSLEQTAQLTLHRKANADKLIEFQKILRKEAEVSELDLKLSLTVMIARATVLALQNFKKMNSRYSGGQLSEFDDVHLGVATSLDEGLVVPVVKNAHQKTIGTLAKEMKKITIGARNGDAGGDLLTGSTFTITNMGASGIEYFTPILNPHETGILGVGSLQEELALTEDEKVESIRKVPFSLTFDHQILDGATAAEFLEVLVKYIESPYLLVL
ncbi:dihydrolipoamide acetyltransferase family protein [Virgibacillus siamensis]|uniref:dihydrolipoamide acetyltransferase family protein n=1 Tax=Virgibacillus siamensis TaxID=480071 RepID=UPI00098692BD|nr:dihydrolipoamide acetyltransferase family protein [Virgibacillus siamensis]